MKEETTNQVAIVSAAIVITTLAVCATVCECRKMKIEEETNIRTIEVRSKLIWESESLETEMKFDRLRKQIKETEKLLNEN